MKKQLLLFLSFVMISAFTMVSAQNPTGSITIVSIQNPIEAGTDGTLELTYTSSVDVELRSQIRRTNANATSVDWSQGYNNIATTLPAAATATAVSIPYPVLIDMMPTADLPDGVNYTFAFELHRTGGGEIDQVDKFAYNDGQQANITTITASSGVTNTLNILSSTVSTVAAGSTIDINFEYTLIADGKATVEVRRYNAENYDGAGGIVAEYPNPLAATGNTPVSLTYTLTIPAGTPLSSELTDPNNYKVRVNLEDPSGSGFSEKKKDLTITAPLAVEDNVKNSFTFYPNPVSDVLTLKSNGLQAKTISIIDVMGRTVRVINNTENLKSIDVSNLKTGLYIINTDKNQQFKFVKK